MAGSGRRALAILFLVTFIDMIGFGIVIPFLTYLVEDLAQAKGISAVGLWVGIIMTAYPFAQFIAAPIWGGLSDRIGRRPILLIGLIGNSVMFTVFGLAPTLLVALVARFFAGFFNGNIPVAKAYIGDVSSPDKLAGRMGLIGAAFGLGFTVGPFLGGELSSPALRWEFFEGTIFETFPYLLPCLFASILSIISLVIAIFWLEESLPEDRRKVGEKSTFSQNFSKVFKESFDLFKVSPFGRLMFTVMFFFFGFTIMHAVFILYTQMPLAEGGLNFSEADNGRIFALIGIFGIIAQGVLIGPLNRRFGTKKLLVYSSVITGMGLVLVPLGDQSNPWPYIIMVCALIAGGNGIFRPSANTIATEYAREKEMELGMVMGSVGAAGAFARVLGPITGGVVWTITERSGLNYWYTIVFAVCGLLMLFACLTSIRLPTTKTKSSNQTKVN